MRYLFSLALLCCCFGTTISGADGTPLVDLQATSQDFTETNFRLQLDLQKAIPGDDPKDLSVTADLVDGTLGGGFGSAGSWNKATHEARFEQVALQGDQISGTLQVVLQPDNWIPADKQPVPMTIAFEGQVERLFNDGEEPYTAAYWQDGRKRQGILATCTGTFTAAAAKLGEPTEGSFTGHFRLPVGASKWTVGLRRDDGILMGFDLGTTRRNWTHMRYSRLDFNTVRDLSAHAGLQLRVTTPEPRQDAVLAVWLKEDDGSWYYYQNAVPLIAATNESTIRFADFEEAEWVSPDGGTSFMDEDFVLDLTSIRSICVGVVNPLGIGPVTYTVQAIDLVGQPQPPATAHVRAGGDTLAINGHEFIPAGLFGGYAPNLPQRYRPGCQRYMKTLPTGGASSLWRDVGFGRGDILDPQAAIATLRSNEDLLAMADAKLVNGLSEYANEPPAKIKEKRKNLQKWQRNAKSSVGKLLNSLLEADDLGLPDPPDLAATLALHEDGSPLDRIANRHRLDQLFPDDQIRPLPAGAPHEAFLIDCQGDRTQQSTFLKHDNWKKHLTDAAVGFAANTAKQDYRIYTEFWNEPYLDWAKGMHYKSKLYRVDLAEEGGPVTVKRANPEDEEVIPYLEWYKKGDQWHVRDTTQFTYWSGRANGWIYDRMFGVYGKAVKEADPKVQVIAGWGMKCHEDHWAAWDILYQPTIDQHIDYIDGIHEHHYMGDTTDIAGSYETVVAYTMTEHDKWVYCHNTETSDLLDIPAVGVNTTPEKAAANRQYRVGTYNLRDIIYLCAQVPDKAMARTVIHNDRDKPATEMCYGSLANLRGRLVTSQSTDSKVWVAASIDGTDPLATRPAGGQALVAAIWNDHRETVEVAISLEAPTGTTFTDGELRLPWFDHETRALNLDSQATSASGDQWSQTIDIPGRAVVVVELPLQGQVPEQAERQRQQFFAKGIRRAVTPGAQQELSIELSDEDRQGCRQVWLRLALEHVAVGEGIVEVNGQRFELPPAICRDNGNLMASIELPIELLQTTNTIVFGLADGNHQGYQVDATSIVIER